jgi:glutamate 5-kinase
MSIKEIIADSRKIVVKVGSNTLAKDDGTVNHGFLEEFAEQAAALMKAGKQLVLVSSGAQVAGISTMGKWARKKDIHYRQALCAVGQVELMGAWGRAFSDHGVHTGQILLTREDFSDNLRTLNMRNTLFTLVDEGIVPIINENDTVSVEEIKIGDNDTLAARTAVLWGASLLIMFSDIDGLYDKNPSRHSDARLIEEVSDVEAVVLPVEAADTNSFGTGGIATKLEAARLAAAYGIPTILANGAKSRALEALAAGRQSGTLFLC